MKPISRVLPGVLAAMLALAATAQDAVSERRYSLMTDAYTGSNIPNKVVLSGLPLDERDTELSPEQQRALKSQ